MNKDNCEVIDFFKSKWSKKNIEKLTSDESDTEDDGILDGKDPGFDDIIIEQTNERITQAIEISSSTETKANIMLGSIGLIFTLGATMGLSFFSNLLKENVYFVFPLGIGSLSLIISFAMAFLVINPRNKLRLITPRKLNNSLSELSLNDVKYNLKHNLIKNYEVIQNGIDEDMRYLRSSILFFISAFVILSLLFVVKISKDLISKMLHG